MTALAPHFAALSNARPERITGVVSSLRGLTLLVEDLPLPIGATVRVGRPAPDRPEPVAGEVVGFSREHAIVMLLGPATGIRPGDPVRSDTLAATFPAADALLGRCVDALGRPIDDLGPIPDPAPRPLVPLPLNAMRRRRITQPLHTGVRAVDLMTPLGRGQRLGIFAGPGVGKSTLLGSIARNTAADVNVIALVGERGREVRDFIEHSLGPQGLARSALIVSTSDEPPLLRTRAALAACAVAEHFRDQGRDVLLMMDSVTRFAHAQRQVGLSVGEPPATKGYTPSVFSNLALLLERAGAVEPDPAAGRRAGSITGLYTILVEGDDMTEPVADAARGILDGHIILSRRLAQRAHYPAIDVLDSVSRVADDITDPAHAASRRQAQRLLALYRDAEDLIQIGAYAAGADPETDVAVEYHPRLTELLRQRPDEREPFDKARSLLVKLAVEAGDAVLKRRQPRGR